MFAKISRTAKASPHIEVSPAPRTFGQAGDVPSRPAVAMPPFWELEALIAKGYGTTDALAIMTRRQAAGSLPVILSGDDDVATIQPHPIRLNA